MFIISQSGSHIASSVIIWEGDDLVGVVGGWRVGEIASA